MALFGAVKNPDMYELMGKTGLLNLVSKADGRLQGIGRADQEPGRENRQRNLADVQLDLDQEEAEGQYPFEIGSCRIFADGLQEKQ